VTESYETLRDAVRLSRRLHDKNVLSFQSHQVSYEQYEIADDGSTKEIQKTFTFDYVEHQKLAAHILKERKVKVSFRRYSGSTTTNVIAMTYAIDESNYVIIYDGNATDCKKRFAFVKELMHIYIGTVEESLTPESIELLLETASMCRRDPLLARKMTPEDFCYFCAIETLIPYGRDGNYRKKFTDLHSKLNLTPYTMAYAVKVPMTVIHYFFECESKYAQQSMAINMNIE